MILNKQHHWVPQYHPYFRATRCNKKSLDISEVTDLTLEAWSNFLVTCVSKHTLNFNQDEHANKSYYLKLLSQTKPHFTVIICSLFYLTRLRINHSLLLHQYPGSLIYTICLNIAYMTMDDQPFTTKAWATLTDRSSRSINFLVRSTLLDLDYKLQISPLAFKKFQAKLLTFINLNT